MHDRPNGRIVALVVTEAFRIRGIGRRLLRHAEDLLVDGNAGQIVVNCALDREDAHAFYDGAGYARIGLRFVKRTSRT